MQYKDFEAQADYDYYVYMNVAEDGTLLSIRFVDDETRVNGPRPGTEHAKAVLERNGYEHVRSGCKAVEYALKK